MNDLQIQNPEAVDFIVNGDFIEKLPVILSNIAELKAWVEKQTAFDRNAIVTEEDVETVKERCTALNKVIQSIDKKRKEVKKAYNEPYVKFERSLNEVTAVLNEARENLWNQYLAFEQKIKDEKREKFSDYWLKINDGLSYRPFHMIENPSWLNKGKSYKAVYKELDEIKEQQQSDLAAIRALGTDFIVELLTDYLKNGKSLSEVISKNAQLKEIKERLVGTKNDGKEESATTDKKIDADVDEMEYEVKFRVVATGRQLVALKRFLMENGIQFFPIQ